MFGRREIRPSCQEGTARDPVCLERCCSRLEQMQHFTRIVAAREARRRLSAGSGHPAAELVRRRPGVSLERAREVTLIGEAGLEGDVAERILRTCEPTGGPIEPQAAYVGAERHAVMGPKDPGQMNGMHADLP